MFTEALVRWWRGVVVACVEAVGVNRVCAGEALMSPLLLAFDGDPVKCFLTAGTWEVLTPSQAMVNILFCPLATIAIGFKV